MLEERNLKQDLLALAMLAVTVFSAIALVDYDPYDPTLDPQTLGDRPSELVYPTQSLATNVCGRAGAIVAHLLLSGLGLAGYYLVASVGVLACWMLLGRPINEPWSRAIGWLISLVGLSTFAAMALSSVSLGPVIGPGGYLGAGLRVLLVSNCAIVGAYIFVVSLILGGLLLCTDYVLFAFAGWAVATPARGAYGRFRRPNAATKPPTRRKIVLAPRPREEANDAARQKPSGAASSQAEADDDGDEDDEAANIPIRKPAPAAEHTAKEGVKRRLKSALRIKGPASKDERQEVIQELEAASRQEDGDRYELPSLDLLLEGDEFQFDEQEKEVRRKAKLLEKTFASFGLNVRVVEIETGPVIAQYEVELEAGLRLSRITGLADDLAIALRVPSVRIVAPIPGKNTVGVEVPNEERQLVRLREVIEETNGRAKKMKIPIYLGKDVAGNPMVVDLASLPHLLIAGRTGTGKSVCLNSIIVSMLMSRRPDEVKMLLIDPKMVELSPYKTLPHLMHPVVTDMRKAEAILAWAVDKMEERYALLARAGVRHIASYNQLGEEELMDRLKPESDEERAEMPTHLPYIVIVADEMADLMMTAAKEVEAHIIRLAQKSRAVGIHLVLATQKPTVDVITGLIKSNLPARIAFQVASRTDSRVVLDEMGADKLLGNGDMLFLWPGTSTLHRGQGTYVSDEEINSVVSFVGTSEPEFVKELVQLKTSDAESPDGARLKNRDDLYAAAVDIVIREGRGSVSLLQRTLGIGYGRAARLIDYMAEDGIVGEYNGSQARDVLMSLEQWLEFSGAAEEAEPTPAPARRRSNRVVLSPDDNAQEEAPFEEDEGEEVYDEAEEDDGEEYLDDADDEYEDEEEYEAESA